jgi:2-polyprenyl-6-methoxyphenol hydroxylase-like FAD-dependent oxidoreductase
VRVQSRLVVGADGAYSTVREAMRRTYGFDYSQKYLEHGYKVRASAPLLVYVASPPVFCYYPSEAEGEREREREREKEREN